MAGGAQPITAVAKVSDGTSHVLDPSGAANFKTVIGAFKTAQIGTYTWAATVTDANGATVTKASPLKFVVVACP